ncbi:hypothetical protein GJV26_14075 [Massilia dura]|uniref:PEP-CTERM sorting domain-containing protein n=1 Tax=Pseudoduganella dura TaxID=321982 RepID=A0A6I3XK51_9BURK|nr:hypothetical protein [Pseudoduganella dura]MUI13582.1 hypothetical protein [Pseudoduganella dura]GGX73868.1 hypothetical protein GCM10007386_00910 [Pseudoduganella dura]
MRFFSYLFSVAALISFNCSASNIEYTAIEKGNGVYDFSYTVNNNLNITLDEITIFFDYTKYTNLIIIEAPMGWDAIVAQPDLAIPADGFVDILAMEHALNPNEVLSGLIVRAQFLGVGSPVGQHYEFIDQKTFQSIASGPALLVPEPSMATLTLLGLLWLVGRKTFFSQIKNLRRWY